MNKTEKKEIQDSLIKSYEILEEKLNKNNETIKELEKELKWGTHQEEKRKRKELSWSRRRFLFLMVYYFFYLFNSFDNINRKFW